jgi:hypothetical protein
MAGFIENKLPQHSPQELRTFVEINYAKDRALSQFVSAAIGA